MRLTESIIKKLNESEQDDVLVKLMNQYWSELENNNEHTNAVKTQEWFKSKGYDLTYDEIENIWDLAGDETDDSGSILNIDGRNFSNKDDARVWLDKKLQTYGNTYHFPPKERDILNQLIEKFGNTYFWYR